MRNKHIESILKSEVESMLPNNQMVAKVKRAEVKPVTPVIKNISEIKEKNKRSIIPMIASCVASLIICLAVFLPIVIKGSEDYRNWLSNNQQHQEQVEDANNNNE